MATGLAFNRCSISVCRTTDTLLNRPTVSVFRSLKFSRRLIGNCSIAAAAPFVVADDEKYGNKQVISLTRRLYDYVLSNVREPKVSPDSCLQCLYRCLEQKDVLKLEFTRDIHHWLWHWLCQNQGVLLPVKGILILLKLLRGTMSLPESLTSHVIVNNGLAAESLKSMIQNSEGSSYDFAFVDADKRMYQEYFELLLQLVRVGGVIVMDNVLWHGRVADLMVNDAKTFSIRNFNQNLMDDKRVSISMVPIGDDMTICRKR